MPTQNISDLAKEFDMLKFLNLQRSTPKSVVKRKIAEFKAKIRKEIEVKKQKELTIKKCGICGKRIRSKNHSEGNQCKSK